MNMGANKAKPMQINPKNIKISSKKPRIPKSLSGIISSGSIR